MKDPQSTAARPGAVRERRARTTLTAFVLGLPLAAGILYFIHRGPLQGTAAQRYVSHPVEYVEVCMFSLALGALAAKLWGYLGERRSCRRQVLPPWGGRPVPPAEASRLLGQVRALPWRQQGTLLLKRVAGVLDFVHGRGSANELDDHLRTLADNDAMALE